MVRIRLQRFGRSHRPFYRIAAMESREPRNGKVLENLGWFNPIETEAERQISLKPDRIKAWIEKGAKPTDTVRDLLAKHDVLDEKAVAAWEADRTARRNAVAAKKAAEKCQALVTEFREFAEQAEAEDAVNTHLTEAKAARKDAAAAARRSDAEGAQALLTKVEDAFAAAKKAEETHQAKNAAAEATASDAESDDAGEEKA